MKDSVSLGAAGFLLLSAALPIISNRPNPCRGTQHRLALLNYLLALVTRATDLFTAVVTNLVCLNGASRPPRGACIRPDGRRDELKSFSGFRGLAVRNFRFRSSNADHCQISTQMNTLACCSRSCF